MTTAVIKDSIGVRCKITSGWSPFTIKWATIAYSADVTEKIVTVTPSTNVSFVLYKLGYKPTLVTINSGLLGGTYDIALTNISEAVDTVLNVDPIIALTSTSIDGSGYHVFFGKMELSLEQMKSTVHRLMKFENYFDAVLVTWDDNIVEIRSDEIRVNKPLFTLERDPALTLSDRVQLNWYINIANAVALNPLYIINPGDSDWLYVTYLTVKPGIDANYLAGKVWDYDTRSLTSSAGLTIEEHNKLMAIYGGWVWSGWLDAIDKKYIKETHQKVTELTNVDISPIQKKLNEIDSHNSLATSQIIDTIKQTETEICSDIVRKSDEIKKDNVATRQLIRQKTDKVVKYAEKQLDRQEKIEKMIEDEADELESLIEQNIDYEADEIEKEIEKQIDQEIQDIESNLQNNGNDNWTES